MNVNSSYKRSKIFIKVLIPEWLHLLAHYSVYCLTQHFLHRSMQTIKLHHLQVSESASDSESCVFTPEGALMRLQYQNPNNIPIHSLKQQHYNTAVFRLGKESCDCNTTTFASTLLSARCHQQSPRLVAQHRNISHQKVLSYGLRQQEAKDDI